MGNPSFRIALVNKLLSNRYGVDIYINDRLVRRAWPPIEARHGIVLSALGRGMSALGMSTRLTGMTTMEQIDRDLDGSFEVSRPGGEGPLRFRRLVACCPHCHGSGFVLSAEAGGGSIACDHVPLAPMMPASMIGIAAAAQPV